MKRFSHRRDGLEHKRRGQAFALYRSLLENFYRLGALDPEVRSDFEFKFFEDIAPLMEKRLVYPELLSDAERKRLVAIDAFLNYFEFAAKAGANALPGDGKQDEPLVLDHWFDAIMKGNPKCCILRRYLLIGFEHVLSRVGFERTPVHLAAYGTLMRGNASDFARATRERLKFVAKCRLSGKAYRIRAEGESGKARYPALIHSWDEIGPQLEGELFEIAPSDAEAAPVLREIDAYEDFFPDDLAGSLYVRRFVPLTTEGGAKAYAWVYLYNRPSAGLETMSGRWQPDG